MKLKRSILAPVVVAMIGLVSGGWLLQRGASPERNVYFQARLFEEVLRHVSDRFVEQRDPADLYDMAIEGMLRELGDPHTTFMTPEQWNRLRVQTQGEYGGLGIEIDERDGWITVLSPLPSSPAERVGLQAGDKILEVDGVSTRGWSSDEAVSELRGPKGSAVNVTIGRVGADEPIEFRIVRDEIHIASVNSAYLMEDGIGYVELIVFSESTADDVRDAVEELRDQGMRGLVLDMRRNPGGLLDQAIDLSDLFLDRSEVVAETRSRMNEQNEAYRARRSQAFPDLPMVVLVGRRSASATEIVAGALQDHDRALILGETSFGKGSVQTLYQLPGDHVLKLTTAKWYTPSGRTIQKPYGPEDGHDVVVADSEREAADAAPDAQDKREAGVEVYRTDGGRQVLGGGGITPDVIVRDTLSTREQEFVETVQQEWGEFNNLLYRYAINYAHENPSLRPGFEVTPEMLGGFHRMLLEAGFDVDRELFDDADFIHRRLASEISTAKFGREEGWKRLVADDPQVVAAYELLTRATTPSSLFSLSSEYARERGYLLGVSLVDERGAGMPD